MPHLHVRLCLLALAVALCHGNMRIVDDTEAGGGGLPVKKGGKGKHELEFHSKEQIAVEEVAADPATGALEYGTASLTPLQQLRTTALLSTEVDALRDRYPRERLFHRWCGKYGDWRDNWKADNPEDKFRVWPQKKSDPLQPALLEQYYSWTKSVRDDALCDLFWVSIGLPYVPRGDWPTPEAYSNLRPDQRVNRLPLFSTHLNQKANFAKAVAAKQKAFGDKVFGFHPKSYVMPDDIAELLRDCEAEPEELWIAKPVYGGQGAGIRLVTGTDIATSSVGLKDGDTIVQRYIPNPFLIDGLKFTLRLYVMVTSLDPLRIYIHNTGVAKFATEPFEPLRSAFNDDHQSMHITNMATNKGGAAFRIDRANPEVDDIGNRRSLRAFNEYCAARGIDVGALWGSVEDAIVKSILCIIDDSREAAASYNLPRGTAFQLLGVDIDLDSDLKPWLIESNVCPSVISEAAFDVAAKRILLRDVFNMAGVVGFDATAYKEELRANLTEEFDKVISDSCQPPQTDGKRSGKGTHSHFCIHPRDVDDFVDLEYEERFKGEFRRLFPVASTPERYFPLFPGKSNRDTALARIVANMEY